MIRASRRGVLAGAMALPAAASVRAARGASGTVLVYDPALAPTLNARGARTVAIAGDPVRFARTLFAAGPALVVGVSRSADALLIADVAREAGYAPVTQGGEDLRAAISADPALAEAREQVWMLAPRIR